MPSKICFTYVVVLASFKKKISNFIILILIKVYFSSIYSQTPFRNCSNPVRNYWPRLQPQSTGVKEVPRPYRGWPLYLLPQQLQPIKTKLTHLKIKQQPWKCHLFHYPLGYLLTRIYCGTSQIHTYPLHLLWRVNWNPCQADWAMMPANGTAMMSWFFYDIVSGNLIWTR